MKLNLDQLTLHTVMSGSSVAIAAEYDLKTDEGHFALRSVLISAPERDRNAGSVPDTAQMYVVAVLQLLRALEAQLEREDDEE